MFVFLFLFEAKDVNESEAWFQVALSERRGPGISDRSRQSRGGNPETPVPHHRGVLNLLQTGRAPDYTLPPKAWCRSLFQKRPRASLVLWGLNRAERRMCHGLWGVPFKNHSRWHFQGVFQSEIMTLKFTCVWSSLRRVPLKSHLCVIDDD